MLKSMLLLLTVCALATCSSTDPNNEDLLRPEQAVVGAWQRIIGQSPALLVFEEGGTFTISYNTLAFEGEYQFSTDGVMFVQDTGCGPNFTGTYSATFPDEEQTLWIGLIDDDCVIRAQRWSGTWSRTGVGQ